MEQTEIISKDIVLRPFSLADSESVDELVGNYNVSKTLQHVPYPYTQNDAKEWIQSHKPSLNEGTRISYAITINRSKELIGAIGLINIDKIEASLGYWVGEPFWGNGYCSKAVSMIITYAKEQLGLKRVYAEHLTENKASGKVMIKNGMQHIESRMVNHKNEGLRLVEIYEILFK